MNQIVALLADWKWWPLLLNHKTLGCAIGIAAVLVVGITVIAKLLIRHRERMTMIEGGMHPDHPQEQSGPQNQS
jgi:hypothetical protein